METAQNIINTAFFYIIGLITLISGLVCLFQKNTINAVISALIAFWGISGLYFLLNAQYLACAQIIIWGVGMGILMLFSVMTTNEKNDKTPFGFSPKIIAAPLICTVFAALIIPFLLYQFGGQNTAKSFSMTEFSAILYKNNTFGFEMTGALLFLALIGISAIIFLKANSRSKKGEFKNE